jgi:hypothetical protein
VKKRFGLGMQTEVVLNFVTINMFEVKIFRSDSRYDVVINNEKIVYGIWSNRFFTRKVNFFDYSNSSLIATYQEKRRLLFSDKRSIFFHQLKTEHQISRKKACYLLNIQDSSYALCYGLLKIKGFFLNDIKVGEIEILKSSNLTYEKRIVFFDNIENYLPFIYLFIPVDYGDFN